MRQVIRLDLVGQEKQEEKVLKPIELTHVMNVSKGWVSCKAPENVSVVVSYLGKCTMDGDMFMTTNDKGYINIYRGRLNDGVY